MTKSSRLFGLGMVGAGLVAGMNLGRCDSIVIGSETPKYAIGEKLKDDAKVELGAQETLRLMNSDSGETRVLSGPYIGAISAYGPGCAGVLVCDPGQKHLSIGATRALNGEPQK